MTVEEERPEFVTCIVAPDTSLRIKVALCGRDLGFEFYFVNVDHALRERARRGRLLVCQWCVTALAEALQR